LQLSALAISVRGRISQIALRVLSDDVPEFSDTDVLIDAGLLDSPGVIELIIWLEDEFKITIAENEVTFANLGSVTAITAFIEAKAI
jgi:acyl carrier protein